MAHRIDQRLANGRGMRSPGAMRTNSTTLRLHVRLFGPMLGVGLLFLEPELERSDVGVEHRLQLVGAAHSAWRYRCRSATRCRRR